MAVDTVAARVVFILCWDAKSSAPITVVLKMLHLLPRLVSSLLMTYMHYDCMHKCPCDHCLLTIRTYSFSGQFTEGESNYYNSYSNF